MGDLEVTIGKPDTDNSYGICSSCSKTMICTLIKTLNSTAESGIVLVKKCSGHEKVWLRMYNNFSKTV